MFLNSKFYYNGENTSSASYSWDDRKHGVRMQYIFQKTNIFLFFPLHLTLSHFHLFPIVSLNLPIYFSLNCFFPFSLSVVSYYSFLVLVPRTLFNLSRGHYVMFYKFSYIVEFPHFTVSPDAILLVTLFSVPFCCPPN